MQAADREDRERRLVALEGSGVRTLGPIRLESELRHIAAGHPSFDVVRSEGSGLSDKASPFRRAAEVSDVLDWTGRAAFI